MFDLFHRFASLKTKVFVFHVSFFVCGQQTGISLCVPTPVLSPLAKRSTPKPCKFIRVHCRVRAMPFYILDYHHFYVAFVHDLFVIVRVDRLDKGVIAAGPHRNVIALSMRRR